MKKLLLVVAAVAVLASLPKFLTAAIEPVTPVTEAFSSTMTVRGILINPTFTSVVVDTKIGYRRVSVLNIDTLATATIYCGENSSTLDTTPVSAKTGWKIASGSSADFSLAPNMQFGCKTDSTVATWAIILRGR